MSWPPRSHDELVAAGRARGRTSTPSTAASASSAQLKALRRGVDIVVACPGRLIDLVEPGHVSLDDVEFVVIDEADRMADMGFLPEVRRLLDQHAEHAPDAAVLGHPRRRRRRARAPLPAQPGPPRAAGARGGRARGRPTSSGTSTRTTASAAAAQVVARHGPTIVFCRTKRGADRVARQLDAAGVRAAAIHGDRSQAQRERALEAFHGGAGRRARRHRRRRPRHPRRRRGRASCTSTRRPTTRTTSTARVAPAGPAAGHRGHARLPRAAQGRDEDAAGAASTRADRGGDRWRLAATILAATASEADRPWRRPRRRLPPRAGTRCRGASPPGPGRQAGSAARATARARAREGRGRVDPAPLARGLAGPQRTGACRGPGSLWSPRRQARPTTRWCRSRPSGPPRWRQPTPRAARARPSQRLGVAQRRTR